MDIFGSGVGGAYSVYQVIHGIQVGLLSMELLYMTHVVCQFAKISELMFKNIRFNRQIGRQHMTLHNLASAYPNYLSPFLFLFC